MSVLLLLLAIPVLALVLRAFTSNDPRWMRSLGLAAAATVLIVPLGAALNLRLSTLAGLVLLGAGPLYLVVWAALSRDRESHRLVSLAAALPGAFAVFILYQFAEHYRG